jgi:transaldolase
MEFFLDTALIDEIREASKWGFIDGVTTNPTLLAQSGKKIQDVIQEMSQIINGPLSAEVNATDAQGMIEEGKFLSKIHSNVVVKIPMTEEGMKALFYFSKHNIKTNVTLIFSPNQALIAAKNGATYVSPFVGRLDDIGHDGMNLIEEIRTIYDNYGFTTKILAASIRHPMHVRDAAMISADVVTCPFKVYKAMFSHPLTTSGLEKFLQDYARSN